MRRWLGRRLRLGGAGGDGCDRRGHGHRVDVDDENSGMGAGLVSSSSRIIVVVKNTKEGCRPRIRELPNMGRSRGSDCVSDDDEEVTTFHTMRRILVVTNVDGGSSFVVA